MRGSGTTRAARARLRKRRFSGISQLNLTSLLDVFTIILVFMLKVFSVSYASLRPVAAMQLPASAAAEEPKRSLAIDIGRDGIYIEKELVQELRDFAPLHADPRQDTLFVLRNALRSKMERGEISLQQLLLRADRDAPFEILWRVMFTARQLGFEEFNNLAVRQGRASET